MHIIYVLVSLAIGFGLGRIHNKQAVEAKIAAAVKEVELKFAAVKGKL